MSQQGKESPASTKLPPATPGGAAKASVRRKALDGLDWYLAGDEPPQDSHINQVVEDALTNPGFVCVFIDPKPSEWVLKLCRADYCGRVYCFGGQWGTFEAFSDEVMPDLEALGTDLEVARTLRELQKTRIPQAE
ncbi:MAG: hypothetical protein WB630_24005 [Candidatus Acidiferrales bacterium]